MNNNSTTNNKKNKKKRKKRSLFSILFIAVLLFLLYAFQNFGGEGLGFGDKENHSTDETSEATEAVVCNIELTNENTILYQDDTFSSVEQFVQVMKDTYPDNLSSVEILIHDDKATQNFYTSVDVALTEASISHRVVD